LVGGYVGFLRKACGEQLIRYRTLFPYNPDPMPSFFRHTLRSRIQNLVLLEGLRSSRGPEKQKRKNNYNSTIFEAKNKVRGNFI
jgi:hypothetical protein